MSTFVRVGLAALLSLFLTSPAFALAGRVVRSDGSPVAGAEVSILGRTGTATTDADGRFSWTPDPPLPFEVLVVAPGGMFIKPILVERLGATQPLLLTVESLVSERITVSGAAPDIEATPTAATASLSQGEIQTRVP